MIDVSYENLFRTIYPTLQDGWRKVVIHAAFIEDSCMLKYHIKQADGTYCDCFCIDYDQRKILEIIANLHRAIAVVRDSLNEKAKWNAITVVIEADGTFNSDFDYDAVDWNSAESIKQWTDKYLND